MNNVIRNYSIIIKVFCQPIAYYETFCVLRAAACR